MEQIKEQMGELKTAKSVPEDSIQLFTIPRIPTLAKGEIKNIKKESKRFKKVPLS